MGRFALDRMLQLRGIRMPAVYADYYEVRNGRRSEHPVIDCQAGSLRDDFDFGPVLLYRTDALKRAVGQMERDYRFRRALRPAPEGFLSGLVGAY